MPELPDIASYLAALEPRVVGRRLLRIVVKSPFLVRTFDPPLESLAGETIQLVSRLGKRIVWHFSGDRYLVFHLMIAGRFHWKKSGTMPRGKNDLAAFHLESGTLLFTEASQKKRASLHVVQRFAGIAAARSRRPGAARLHARRVPRRTHPGKTHAQAGLGRSAAVCGDRQRI